MRDPVLCPLDFLAGLVGSANQLIAARSSSVGLAANRLQACGHRRLPLSCPLNKLLTRSSQGFQIFMRCYYLSVHTMQLQETKYCIPLASATLIY